MTAKVVQYQGAIASYHCIGLPFAWGIPKASNAVAGINFIFPNYINSQEPKQPSMRTPNKVERVRGVSDVLWDTCHADQKIQTILQNSFESFGYRPIDVPIIEHTELYLRKSGEDLIARTYDFTHHNRRLCLRPELTASIARAYIDNLQAEPLPVRLYYQGPAFRYEKPQRGRSRQFNQMGIELIGAAGVMADAESIALACKGLEQLGLTNYYLALGNNQVLGTFLERLHLENRLCNFLMASMETLRKEGKHQVIQRLQEIYPDFEPYTEEDPTASNPEGTQKLVRLFQQMGDREAKSAILELIESMNIRLDRTRDPDEIAHRLLAKIRRQDQSPMLNHALDFMQELSQLRGTPEEVFPAAEKLLASHHIESSALNHLRELITALDAYHIDKSRIYVDFGMSRGLQYYTSTVFEIHYDTGKETRQLCGGGRYDELIATLGSRKSIPATGFSYGIERLRWASEQEGLLEKTSRPADILMIPVSEGENSYAIEVAEKLRQYQLRVQMAIRGKQLSSNFQYADRTNIPFAVVVGSEEKTQNLVRVKHLASGQQQQFSIPEAVEYIQSVQQSPS